MDSRTAGVRFIALAFVTHERPGAVDRFRHVHAHDTTSRLALVIVGNKVL